MRPLIDTYRSAGGRGPIVVIVRVWIGDPPSKPLHELLSVYAAAGAPSARSGDDKASPILAGSAYHVIAGLKDIIATIGADAVNLRVHLPDVALGTIDEQINEVGKEVVPELRAWKGMPMSPNADR